MFPLIAAIGPTWAYAAASDVQAEYFRMREALKPRPFCVKTASEAEIRERCRALGKSKEYEDFCVMAFAWKMRRKQLAAEMGYSESAVRRYVTRFRRELEGKIANNA